MNPKKIYFLVPCVLLSFIYFVIRNFYPNLFTVKEQNKEIYFEKKEEHLKEVESLLKNFENILKEAHEPHHWSFEDQVKEFYLQKKDLSKRMDLSALDYFVKGNKLKQNDLAAAKNHYQKALEVFKTNKDKLGEKIALSSIAEVYRMERDAKKSLKIFRKALNIEQNKNTQLFDAFIYRGIGKAYTHLNDFDQSEKYLYKSLELFEENDEHRGVVSNYIDCAISKYYSGHNMESISNSLKAGRTLLNTSDPFGMAYVCINLGQVYYSLGEYKLAKELLKFSLRVFKKYTDIRGEAITLKSLGYIARVNGHFEVSKNYYDHALKLFKKISHLQGIAECMNGLGKIMISNGDYSSAEKNFFTSLKYFKNIDSKWAIAHTFRYLGDLNEKKGDYIKSENYYWRALGIFKEIKNTYGETCVYHKLGELFLEKEKYEEAKKYLLIAKSLFSREYNSSREAVTTIILAHVEFKLGNILESKELLKEALRYYEKIGSAYGKARCFYGLGKVYSYQGDQARAKKYFSLAYNRFEQIKYKFGKAKTIQLLGVIAYRSGYYISAKNNFLTSLELYQEMNYTRGYTETLSWLGATYIYLGKIKEAKRLLEKGRAESIHKKAKALSYGKLAKIYSIEGKFDKAINYYEKSLSYFESMGDNRWVSILNKSIGNLYSSINEYEKAETHFFKSLSFGKKIGINYELSRTCLHLGELESELGNLSLSDKYYKEALKNQFLFENKKLKIEAYNMIGKSYFKTGNYNEAENYFSKAYAISIEINDIYNKAFLLLHMGRLDLVQKKLDRARYKLEQALRLFIKMDFKPLIELTKLYLTNLKFKQTHEKSCINNYNQLQRFFLTFNKKVVAESLCYIGDVYYYYQEREKALGYYKKALKLIEEIKNFSKEGMILRKIARSLIELKRYSEAENCLDLSKDHAEKTSNTEQYIKTHISLGYLFYKMGKYKDSLNVFEKTLITAKEKGGLKEIGRCTMWIGAIYIKLKNAPRARQFLNNSLGIFTQEEVYWFQALNFKLLGKLECILNNYKEAIDNYEIASKLWNDLGNDIEQNYVLFDMFVIYKKNIHSENKAEKVKRLLLKKLNTPEKANIHKLFENKIKRI